MLDTEQERQDRKKMRPESEQTRHCTFKMCPCRAKYSFSINEIVIKLEESLIQG
jgi:hypothetical protein